MKATTFTIGSVAERLGVRPWQIRRLFERGDLPPAARVACYRIFNKDDLPAIRRALKAAGYLPAKAVAIK